MAIPQDKFLDLGNLVLKTTSYAFSSQFFRQTDGIEIGGPASSTTAEAYMQNPEKFRNNLLMTFIQFLNVHNWKKFSIHQRSSSKHYIYYGDTK